MILSMCAAAYAQKSRVTAVLVDGDTRQGLPGAILEFSPVKNPDQKSHFTSGYKGKVDATLPYGTYKLSVSFLGYDTLEREVAVARATTHLDTLVLKPASTHIETVVKEVQSMRSSQRGDTISYNAGAFKVSSDADVEGLLKKMPGITVTDGEVEAQGEKVKKIFVDGKEFFGEDVTSAIKSLPAEAVNKIEVYDKLSDQAEFSGMDDGEGYKALNIVTHAHMRQGQFGKMYAGYGYQPETRGMTNHNKYTVGGNVNIFSGNHRLSFIGLFNNLNQQNFSFEDILGVSGGSGSGVGAYMTRPQSGVASVNSFGINYSSTWGKTGDKDKIKLEASYFFNQTGTKNASVTDRWFEDPSPVDTLHQEGYSNNKNLNNRINARFEWRISENQSLMSRTGISFQSYDPYSTTWGHRWGQSGYSVIDNYNSGDRNGYNLNEFLSYRVKLGKPGRTLTLDGHIRYNDSENDSYNHSNTARAIALGEILEPADTLDLRYQRIFTPSYRYNLNGNFTYTEPLSKYSALSLQYRIAYNYQQSDKRSYLTGSDFDYTGLEPDPSLSRSSNTSYLTHRIGPGFRWNKNKNRFIANLSYQHAELSGEVLSSSHSKVKQGFDNLTYFMMGQLYITPENSLRLFVNSSTSNPGITQLQDVYDVSNAQYITKGNPNLVQSYSNNIRFHYVRSKVEKGRTFMWMFSMTNTSDYVTSSVEYDKEIEIEAEDGKKEIYHPLEYSTYVNMDGYWSLRTHLSYGLPLSWLKCNLNLMGGVNYSIVPSMVGGQRNDASNIGYDFSAVLGSNISEKIDFTLSWRGTYNEAENSLATVNRSNRYFSHNASGSLKLVFWKGFTFTANASYSQYIGFTNDYDDSYVLCAAYLGKKLFRNQRGEVLFGVYDIFDQNKAFSRTTGSGYTQNAFNSIIGRYYTVQFVYNLRHFGKKGSKNIKDYDGMGTLNNGNRPGGRRPPMGRPMEPMF